MTGLLEVARFEGDLFQKLFKGYIFCFLGHLYGRYIFELSARETNLMKKRSVILRGTGFLDWNDEPENRNIYPIACVLAVLNSSINFIVYSVFNPKFRTVLASIFRTKAYSNSESTEKGTLRLDLMRANSRL